MHPSSIVVVDHGRDDQADQQGPHEYPPQRHPPTIDGHHPQPHQALPEGRPRQPGEHRDLHDEHRQRGEHGAVGAVRELGEGQESHQNAGEPVKKEGNDTSPEPRALLLHSPSVGG